jgi:hypothetical protein
MHAGEFKPWIHPSLVAQQPQQDGMSDAELVGVYFGLHPEEFCLHNLLGVRFSERGHKRRRERAAGDDCEAACVDAAR